jgi:hypothetical protein
MLTALDNGLAAQGGDMAARSEKAAEIETFAAATHAFHAAEAAAQMPLLQRVADRMPGVSTRAPAARARLEMQTTRRWSGAVHLRSCACVCVCARVCVCACATSL